VGVGNRGWRGCMMGNFRMFNLLYYRYQIEKEGIGGASNMHFKVEECI
jgi:hypothetical protein